MFELILATLKVMPHRVLLFGGPLKHTRLSGLLGLCGISFCRCQVNPRVFTRKRAYSPGEDCRDIYGYDVESFELITLDGFMELGEEKWLFSMG